MCLPASFQHCCILHASLLMWNDGQDIFHWRRSSAMVVTTMHAERNNRSCQYLRFFKKNADCQFEQSLRVTSPAGGGRGEDDKSHLKATVARQKLSGWGGCLPSCVTYVVTTTSHVSEPSNRKIFHASDSAKQP